LIFGVERHFQQYFSYIMATSFSGGRSQREPTGQATGKFYPWYVKYHLKQHRFIKSGHAAYEV
jgi:hypothetical protein